MNGRKAFSPEFECVAANLVVDRGYSIAQACEAMGVGKTAMQRWVHQFNSELGGVTPDVGKALTLDQHRIQGLEVIRILSERYPVVELCLLFGLPRSRYYYCRYETRSQGIADIIDYIDSFYNLKRRHYRRGNISPNEH